MATIAENITTIKNSIDRMKEALNLPSNTPLENLTVAVESGAGSGGGSVVKSNIYKVATIAERDAITDMVEGDMCVVITGGVENANVNSQFQVATFPSVVVLPSTITNYIDVRYSAVDSNIMFDSFGMIDSSSFMLECYTDSGSIRIQYTSSDGKTYTRTTSDEVVDFGTPIYYEYTEMWNDLIGYFIQIDGVDFNGLFTYTEGTWEFSKIGTKASNYQVDKSCKVYTNNGMVQGVLGTSDGKSINLIENYVANMDFSNIENCANMFDGVDTNTSIFFNKISTFNTSNAENMEAMFRNCSKLTSLDLSNFNTSNVKSMREMFYNCTEMLTLDVSSFDTINVEDTYNMFYDNDVVTTLDTTNWNLNKVKDAGRMFSYCEKLANLDTTNWGMASVENCKEMFINCYALTSLNTTNWSMQNAKVLDKMFYNCSKLATLDVSNWDTRNLVNAGSAFAGCKKLTALDVSKWNTDKVENMSSMFSGCDVLATLDVSNFNTENVTNMSQMFINCYALGNQDFSKWNTSKATNMNGMFAGCRAMTRIDLSSFDTSNVTNMQTMFFNCTKLTYLDIRNFDFSKVTNYTNMLGNDTPTNCLIIVKDQTAKNWITSKFTKYTNVKTVAEYGG